MATSRIFVRGLPPNFSEEDFKKHFSSQQTITDARLIPRRRIGYIGYKTPEDAAKAVNYFNKSFIRLSRIFVELARPVSCPWCCMEGNRLTKDSFEDNRWLNNAGYDA
jgi:multiple RNA-binding domain-containing protein 1